MQPSPLRKFAHAVDPVQGTPPSRQPISKQPFPVEIMELIFGFLDLKSLARSKGVCRLFRAVITPVYHKQLSELYPAFYSSKDPERTIMKIRALQGKTIQLSLKSLENEIAFASVCNTIFSPSTLLLSYKKQNIEMRDLKTDECYLKIPEREKKIQCLAALGTTLCIGYRDPGSIELFSFTREGVLKQKWEIDLNSSSCNSFCFADTTLYWGSGNVQEAGSVSSLSLAEKKNLVIENTETRYSIRELQVVNGKLFMRTDSGPLRICNLKTCAEEAQIGSHIKAFTILGNFLYTLDEKEHDGSFYDAESSRNGYYRGRGCALSRHNLSTMMMERETSSPFTDSIGAAKMFVNQSVVLVALNSYPTTNLLLLQAQTLEEIGFFTFNVNLLDVYHAFIFDETLRCVTSNRIADFDFTKIPGYPRT